MSSSETGQAGPWHGTTILTVRKGGLVAVGGDGQVSIGQTIVKANAKKVRRHEACLRGAPHHVEHDAAVLVAGGDI